MNIEINCEYKDLRATVSILSTNIETHSAITEVPKEDVESVRHHIRKSVEDLLISAHANRKVTG